MRFLVMHKVDPGMEAGEPPNQEIVEKMGELVGNGIKAGIFENGAGLHRSAMRVRVAFSKGERRVTQGPFSGNDAALSAMVMVKARGIQQAIEHATRVARACGEPEIEIGPVVEPWDLGIMPKPEGDLPGKFLLLLKSDAQRGSAFRSLVKQMTDEGVVLMIEELAPGGKRLPAGKRTWIDGPFAESKEMVAGFSILNLPSESEVLAWAEQYAAILGRNEVEARVLET